MSADFWAGYVSGAAGIIIGNPLDIVKVQLQRGARPELIPASPSTTNTTAFAPSPLVRISALYTQALKGTAAPILGYGALNALLFVTYNRSMTFLSQDPTHPSSSSLDKIWISGACAGLATFVVSAPTELVKCRAQTGQQSSWDVARGLWREGGVRGLYWGGAVTSVRDCVGYGFYFWSYELSKRVLTGSEKTEKPEWMSVLLCGGIAGVITWASVFPLDVIKTRLQTQNMVDSTPLASSTSERAGLLQTTPTQQRLTTIQIAQQAYRNEGLAVFFRGLGVCSVRAFFVNAVQWAVYEWMMHLLLQPKSDKS